MKKRYLTVLLAVLLVAVVYLTVALFGQYETTQPEQPTIPWYIGYEDLLWYRYIATAHLPAEERPLFTIYDINNDGVPQLIIWEAQPGGGFFATRTYHFAFNKARTLEMAEHFGGRPASLTTSSTPGDSPGMVVHGGGEGFSRHMLVNIRVGSLHIDVSMVTSASPWDRGYNDVLRYVSGLDITAIELPDFLYWLEEEHIWMTSRGYVLVTEEDFTPAFYDMICHKPERQFVAPLWLNEANIHRANLQKIFS